jgi:hypothetical protein
MANATIDTLWKLCKIFDISLSDLFMLMERDRRASEDREAVVLMVARLLKW